MASREVGPFELVELVRLGSRQKAAPVCVCMNVLKCMCACLLYVLDVCVYVLTHYVHMYIGMYTKMRARTHNHYIYK